MTESQLAEKPQPVIVHKTLMDKRIASGAATAKKNTQSMELQLAFEQKLL